MPNRRPRRLPARSLLERKIAEVPTAYARILAVVRRIPRGRVATYGQVAALAGYPTAPRLAGYALFSLPDGTPIPWHRVVAVNGKLSIGRLSPDGAITQRLRLEKEGVRFNGRGYVQIERFQWGAARDACGGRRRRARRL